jgi:hypothetical protein
MGPGLVQHAAAAAAAVGLVASTSAVSVAGGAHRSTAKAVGGSNGAPAPRRTNQGAYMSPYSRRAFLQRGGDG